MALFRGRTAADDRQGTVNAAKTLLANVRFMSVDKPVSVLAFTSAVPNEGKSSVSINFANAAATSGKSVLIVEADMRRRSLANSLGVHAKYGLYAVVSQRVTLDEAVVPVKGSNKFFFLDAEPQIPNPSDLLSSNLFTKFIEVARSKYDYVVFDTPPVCTFVDAAVLGAKVDSIFMVVREHFAKKSEIVDAYEQLKKAGCNVGGVVMNWCDQQNSDYYYEYYKRGHHDESAPDLVTGFFGRVSEMIGGGAQQTQQTRTSQQSRSSQQAQSAQRSSTQAQGVQAQRTSTQAQRAQRSSAQTQSAQRVQVPQVQRQVRQTSSSELPARPTRPNPPRN